MRNSAELDKARALVVEDPEIFSGTPVIRNTRIPSRFAADMPGKVATVRELCPGTPANW